MDLSAWLHTDLEGNPRPQDGGYDLGVLEGIRWDLLLPLVMKSYP
jgi:hypothetical protein